MTTSWSKIVLTIVAAVFYMVWCQVLSAVSRSLTLLHFYVSGQIPEKQSMRQGLLCREVKQECCCVENSLSLSLSLQGALRSKLCFRICPSWVKGARLLYPCSSHSSLGDGFGTSGQEVIWQLQLPTGTPPVNITGMSHWQQHPQPLEDGLTSPVMGSQGVWAWQNKHLLELMIQRLYTELQVWSEQSWSG